MDNRSSKYGIDIACHRLGSKRGPRRAFRVAHCRVRLPLAKGACTRFDDRPQLPLVRYELLTVRANLPKKPIEPLLRDVLGIGESVENPVAVPAIADQSSVSQVREMARYIGLRSLQDMLDIAHAQLAMKEQIENPKPRHIR